MRWWLRFAMPGSHYPTGRSDKRVHPALRFGYGRHVINRSIPPLPVAPLIALALCLAPTLLMAQSARGGLTPTGNPSALVEAESALAHLARAKGANAALAATGDETAEFVAPARSPAKLWLKTHDASAWFAGRQTGMVWASCDGTAGVSAGIWDGGWFAVVWKRQKKLDYKWLLADAAPLATMPPAPDWITGKLADCPPRIPHEDGPPERKRTDQAGPPPLRPLPAAVPPLDAHAGAASRDGRSDDGSLVWRSTILPDGSRSLHVWIWQDGAMHGVIDRDTPAHEG